MHNALRMHHHTHAGHFHIKQPAGFNHFQPLVKQGRGIYGDFTAHHPRRMFQGAFDRDPGKTVLGPQLLVAERTAGSREPELADGTHRLAIQALKNGGMLAIHRQHAHPMDAGLVHDDFSGHHQDFLGGHGNVLARPDGRERRLQSRRAHNGDQHNIGGGQGGQFQQAFRARMNLHIAAQRRLQFTRFRRIADRDDFRPVPPRLFQQQGGVITRRQAHQPDLIGQIFRHFYRAGADGTGAAKENDVFHLNLNSAALVKSEFN